MDNLKTQLCSNGRLNKLRKLAGLMFGVAMAMSAMSAVGGAIAYLPSIGPAPMRFEPAEDPDTMFAWKSLNPLTPTAKNSSASVPDTGIVTNATNAVIGAAGSLPSTNDTIVAASTLSANPGAKTNLETSPGSAIWPSSDESSSPVTAQILAGFFKPAPGGKPVGEKDSTGTAVIVQPDIGFTPPSPGPAPESKAMYRSQ